MEVVVVVVFLDIPRTQQGVLRADGGFVMLVGLYLSQEVTRSRVRKPLSVRGLALGPSLKIYPSDVLHVLVVWSADFLT